MRHGSLFSGIGGFDLAAEWMGWTNIFHCEDEVYPSEGRINALYDIESSGFISHTDNIHRDKRWTAGGGVAEDSTKWSRILIDTERLGDLRTTPDTESSGSQREYKCGSWENEPIGRDCQEVQACWENFPTQPPICGRDDGISDRLDGITFPKLRAKSIEGYGNAVVPQVVYQIFKAIERVEYEHRHIKMQQQRLPTQEDL